MIFNFMDGAHKTSACLCWIVPVSPIGNAEVAINQCEHIVKTCQLGFLQNGSDAFVSTADVEDNCRIFLPDLSQIVACQLILDPQIDCATIETGKQCGGRHFATTFPNPESHPFARGSSSGTRK